MLAREDRRSSCFSYFKPTRNVRAFIANRPHHDTNCAPGNSPLSLITPITPVSEVVQLVAVNAARAVKTYRLIVYPTPPPPRSSSRAIVVCRNGRSPASKKTASVWR